MVFRRFEDVERNAEYFACFFVNGVEEVEEDLRKLASEPCLRHTWGSLAYLQPLVHNIHLL
jgi:hypothetical protein